MLQSLRDKTSGWIAFVVLGIVTIPFAFFGINNYFETRTETYVARVGEVEISPQQLADRIERIRQAQGEGVDPAYFDQPDVRRRILDQMIDEEVLAQAAASAGTEASDARLRDEIAKVPAFQDETGKFDPNIYRTLLTSQGQSVETFQRDMRRDLSLREMPIQVAQSSVVSDAQIDRWLTLTKQTRDLRYAIIPPQPADKDPTEEEIKSYYDAHQSEFMTEELVALEYVELKAADMQIDATPDEDTLRARYEEQKARFLGSEQRAASHILVKVDKNADADAQKAAQAKAADLAKRARAGEDFAELAKANSDDVGSKAQGGDLGVLEKGVTEPAFETALFALPEGGISDPVKTDEGYHVIKVGTITPADSKTFEQARAELEAEFADSERERVFAETSGALIDKVYENPESLAEAAKDQGLEVKRTELFSRRGGTDPITQHPEVLKAAFSDRVLVEGQVSDPIEVEPNHLVVVRADEHKASVARPIAEVRDAIVERLRQQRATELTEKRAKELETKLESGVTLEALAAEAGAEVQSAEGVGREALNLEAGLVREAFKLPRPAQGKASRAVVEMRPGAHAIVEVTKVTDGDPKLADKAERDRVREQLLGAIAGVESRALVDVLRAGMEIQIVEDRM